MDGARGEPTSVQDVSDGRIAQSRLDHPVFVSDSIPGRQRRLEDGLEAILSLAGVGLVLLLGVYAQSTTQGVEEDVRAALAQVIRQILFLPLSLLEGIFVITVPIALIIYLLRRGDYTTILYTVLTGIASALCGWGILLALPHLPQAITASLVVTTPTGTLNSVNVVFMVITAMVTTVGTTSAS